jgi:hypothetical protein
MITAKQIRELIQAQPFKPFRISLSDGTHYDITNHDTAFDGGASLPCDACLMRSDGDCKERKAKTRARMGLRRSSSSPCDAGAGRGLRRGSGHRASPVWLCCRVLML